MLFKILSGDNFAARSVFGPVILVAFVAADVHFRARGLKMLNKILLRIWFFTTKSALIWAVILLFGA